MIKGALCVLLYNMHHTIKIRRSQWISVMSTEDIQKMTEKRGNHRFGVLVRGSSCQKHFNLPHNTLDHRLGIDCSAYVDSPSLVILITCLFVYPVQSNGYT